MNSITIAGNLTRDAEIRYLPNGDAVASFAVADNQGKDKPAIFWNCSLFGKRGESLAQYLTKGTSVTVSGNITEREYEKDGQKRKAMDIRVADVALQGGGQRQEAAPAPAPRRQAAPAAAQSFDDSDIPF